MNGEPKLQYVLDKQGQAFHVSDCQRENEFFCPECRERVVLKLGDIRVHHAAHKANSTCPATNPETAIHLNTKYYLVEKLKAAQTVRFHKSTCTGCGQEETITVSDWDDVAAEVTWEGYRLDVGLSKAGQVIAAIEVLVSHKVDQTKKSRLESIPWIEIRGEKEFYSGEHAWTPDKILYPVQAERRLCDKCKQTRNENQFLLEIRLAEEKRQREERIAQEKELLLKQEEQRRAAQAELKKEQIKREQEQSEKYKKVREERLSKASEKYKTLFWMLVEFHFPGDKLRYRDLYRIHEKTVNDISVETALTVDGIGVPLEKFQEPANEHILSALKKIAHQAAQSKGENIVFDSIGEWRDF